MPRPLPTMMHGPRSRGRAMSDRRIILGAPKASPEWELGALRVLMKPHDWTRGAIAHRTPFQTWPADGAARVDEAFAVARQRLGFDATAHFPEAGDFHFLAQFTGSVSTNARALALLISRRLPGLWLTVDRLFVRDGKFYRRERGFKLNLAEATNVHLPRETRAKLKGLL